MIRHCRHVASNSSSTFAMFASQVQLHTIPVALGGGDVIVQAKSGTGRVWDPSKDRRDRPQEFLFWNWNCFFVLGMCFVFLFPCFFAFLRQTNLLFMLLFFFASPVLCFSALVFPRFFFSLLLCFFASLLLHCYTSLLFSAL